MKSWLKAAFLNENHARLRKNCNIRTSISAFYHQFFLFSFDLTLSCKLHVQLIDIIMVSAVCLAGRQTILVCFFPENCGFTGKEKRQMDGKLKIQIHPTRFVSKVVCPVPKIAIDIGWPCANLIFSCANTIISRHVCAIIWCPECWKWHFRASRFQNFLGGYAPRPPRLMGLTAPCSYSRLFSSNQLPTSNFFWNPCWLLTKCCILYLLCWLFALVIWSRSAHSRSSQRNWKAETPLPQI